MLIRRFASLAVLALAVGFTTPLAAAEPEPTVVTLERQLRGLSFELDQVRKAVDDVFWFQRLGDVAEVDKVTLVGPPNPRGEETFGIANERHPFKVHQYVFVPKQLDRGR